MISFHELDVEPSKLMDRHKKTRIPFEWTRHEATLSFDEYLSLDQGKRFERWMNANLEGYFSYYTFFDGIDVKLVTFFEKETDAILFVFQEPWHVSR